MKTKFSAILVAFLAVASFMTSCSKDETAQPAVVGFAKEAFDLDLKNQATFKIVSTQNVAESQNVDFTISSDLVEGVDYTISSNKFTFEKGQREASVVVTFLNEISSEDKFEMNLGAVTFGTLGLSKASVGVDINNAILYTFDKSSYIMTATAEVTLQLSKVTGSFTAEENLTFEVELDPSSTAEEGVHFNFDGGKTITIPAGQNKGTIKLNFIKQENDKDQVVLKLKQVPFMLKPGNYDKAQVGIFGNIYDKMIGQWAFKAMTNVDWWLTNAKYNGDDLTLLPKNGTTSDLLTFDEDGIKVSMTGVLKNYFRNSQLATLGEETEVLQEVASFPPSRVQILLVKALANVNFSATQVNERDAEIGFRVFTDTDGEEILEVTIRDYEPTDFLQKTFTMYKSFGDSPVLKSMPLRYHFTKVK